MRAIPLPMAGYARHPKAHRCERLSWRKYRIQREGEAVAGKCQLLLHRRKLRLLVRASKPGRCRREVGGRSA